VAEQLVVQRNSAKEAEFIFSIVFFPAANTGERAPRKYPCPRRCSPKGEWQLGTGEMTAFFQDLNIFRDFV
jgi:hypothetical protein